MGYLVIYIFLQNLQLP